MSCSHKFFDQYLVKYEVPGDSPIIKSVFGSASAASKEIQRIIEADRRIYRHSRMQYPPRPEQQWKHYSILNQKVLIE